MKIVLEEKETKKQSFLYKVFTNYYVWLVILIILMSAGIWQCGFIISFMLWYKILDILVRLMKYIIKIVKNILNTQQ